MKQPYRTREQPIHPGLVFCRGHREVSPEVSVEVPVGWAIELRVTECATSDPTPRSHPNKEGQLSAEVAHGAISANARVGCVRSGQQWSSLPSHSYTETKVMLPDK